MESVAANYRLGGGGIVDGGCRGTANGCGYCVVVSLIKDEVRIFPLSRDATRARRFACDLALLEYLL